ncbi:hypothetical protein AGMMS4952_23290 [Spirochaetia bacterium]|nr:hypothetical protein AGMMS4952_23290 [Spirochaetia bacterium]
MVTVPLLTALVTAALVYVKLSASTPLKLKPVFGVRVTTALYTVEAAKAPV